MVRLAGLSLFDAMFSPPTGMKRPMKILVTHAALPSAVGTVSPIFCLKYRATPPKLRTIPTHHTRNLKISLQIQFSKSFILNVFLLKRIRDFALPHAQSASPQNVPFLATPVPVAVLFSGSALASGTTDEANGERQTPDCVISYLFNHVNVTGISISHSP